MPAATTHAEFARNVLNHLPEDIRKKITSLPMFYLGSQGPDLLFFSRFMILPGSLGKYGQLMHSEKIREVIHFLDRNCVTPSLRSYYYGYLTHYALDSTCHGLITAFSKAEQEKTGVPEEEAHFRIEGELDVWTMNQLGKKISDYRIHKMTAVSQQEINDLAKLYHTLFEQVYGLEVNKERFREACNDTMISLALLYPNIVLHKVVGFAENLVKAPRLITGMMWTDKEGAVPELLNFSHKPWTWFGEQRSSYPELYDKALELALKLCEKPEDRLIKKNFNSQPIDETIL